MKKIIGMTLLGLAMMLGCADKKQETAQIPQKADSAVVIDSPKTDEGKISEEYFIGKSVRLDTVAQYNSDSTIRISEDLSAEFEIMPDHSVSQVFLFENQIQRKKFCEEHPGKCRNKQVSTSVMVFPSDYSSMIFYERKQTLSPIKREDDFSYIFEVGYDSKTRQNYLVDFDSSLTLDKAKSVAALTLNLYELIMNADKKRK